MIIRPLLMLYYYKIFSKEKPDSLTANIKKTKISLNVVQFISHERGAEMEKAS